MPKPNIAFRQGREAYYRGHNFGDCPYPDAVEGDAWQSGWLDAQREHVESGEVHDAEA